MYTTYLKDCSDIAYPLLNTGRRPFSDSLLLGMVLGAQVSDTSIPVTLSYLSTKSDSLYAEVSRAGSIIGTFTHEGSEAGSCSFTPRPGVSARGILFVGGIPEQQRELEWQFDPIPFHPGCVSLYKEADNGILRVQADNGTADTEDVLTISASNGIQAGMKALVGRHKSLSVPNEYAKVTSINRNSVYPGCRITLATDAETLNQLRFAGNGDRLRRKGAYELRDCVAVTLNGTQQFPSCYVNDEAATDGEASNKLSAKEGGRI